MDTEKLIGIKYKGSVKVAAGWRAVEFAGTARMLSPKRCEVVDITHINDEPVGGTQSITGAKRQQFYGVGVAKREQGSIKNISSLVEVTYPA